MGEADGKRRQLIDAKNEIESLIYSTEKSLTDNGDKLDADTKSEIEKAISEAKEVKDSEDIEAITGKKDALNNMALKIGQAVYKQSKDDNKEGEEGGEEKKDDDNTVDADFTETDKKEDEKKDDDDKKDSKN